MILEIWEWLSTGLFHVTEMINAQNPLHLLIAGVLLRFTSRQINDEYALRRKAGRVAGGCAIGYFWHHVATGSHDAMDTLIRTLLVLWLTHSLAVMALSACSSFRNSCRRWRQHRKEKRAAARTVATSPVNNDAVRPRPQATHKKLLDEARFHLAMFYASNPQLQQHLPLAQFEKLKQEALPPTLDPWDAKARAIEVIDQLRTTAGIRETTFTSDEAIIKHFTQLMETYRNSGIYSEDELETLWIELRGDMHEQIRERHQR